MKMTSSDLKQFLKHSFTGAFFTLISFVSFEHVVRGTKDDIGRILRFSDNNELMRLIAIDFGDFYTARISIIFWVLAVFLCFIVFTTAIFAKVYFAKAEKVLIQSA